MKITDIVPYYSDLQLARLLACAYVSGAISLAAAFLLSRFVCIKLSFEQIAAFCFLASGALWLMPLISHIPDKFINYFLLGILLALLPLIRVFYEESWKHTFWFWLIFALTQFGFYIWLINS